MPERKHPQLVCDLIRRRRELARDINALQADLAAIDHVLRLYRPDMAPETIPALSYKKPADCAARGEVARFIVNTLRREAEPMGVAELTRLAMTARGIAPDQYARHVKGIRRALAKLKTRGTVAAHPDGGRFLWCLAD